MLYSVKTGERIDAPSDQWKDLLSTGEYNFDPNSTVPFIDQEGNPVEVSGAEASNYILNPYATSLRPATSQDIQGINKEATYGTIGQELLTGAESLASGATLGLSRAATQKAIETTAGKEAGQRYTEATRARQETNPAVSIAGEVAGIILPTGPASKALKVAEGIGSKVATKTIKGITSNELAKKAASKAGKYMAEGGVIDGAYEFSNQTIDENPYNAEALIDRTADGALFNTILGGGLEATIKGTSRAAKKVGEKTLGLLNKFTDGMPEAKAPDFYEVSGLELDRVNSASYPNKKAVKAIKTPEGIFYNDGKKKVKLSTEGMSGIDLSNELTANDYGQKFGIENFYKKHKFYRYAGEPLDEFIYRTQEVDQLAKDIENSIDSFTPVEQERFSAAKNVRDSYAKLNLDGNVTSREMQQIREEIMEAEDEIRNLYEKKYQTAANPTKEQLARGIEQRKNRIAYEKSKSKDIPPWFKDELDQKYSSLGAKSELSEGLIKKERADKVKQLRKEIKEGVEGAEDKLKDLETTYNVDTGRVSQYEQEIKRLEQMLSKEEREVYDTIRKNRISQIGDDIGSYSYIDDGDAVYFNGDNLNNATFGAERVGSRAEKSGLAKNIIEQYKPTAAKLKRFSNEELNEVAEYIKSKYPNQLEKFGDVKTPVDFIYKQIENDLDLGIRNRADAIIKMNNIADALGKQVRLTNKDIADFLELSVLPQYSTTGLVDGKKALVPKPNMSEAFNTVQKMIDEYRASDVSLDPITKIPKYKELNIKEAIQKRVDIDRATNWTTEAERARNEANKEIRGFIEDRVASRAQRADPVAYQSYLDAKKQIKNALRAQEIVSNAYAKALKESGIKLPFFKLGLFGSVGGMIGGAPAGIATAAAVGYVDNLGKNYAGNLGAYFSGGIAKEGLKFLNKIDLSAQKFLKASTGTRRAIVAITGKKAEDQMEADQKKFTEELQAAENFTESFMQENDALIEMAPRTTAKILETAKKSREFLLSKIPQNPYQGIPYREKLWKPSSQDVQKYIRYREAVLKPSVVLDQIADGYVTPEAVEVLREIYPETLNRLKEQLLKNLEDETSLPVEKRLLLQDLLDIPLEATPETFNVYQSNALQSQEQAMRRQQVQPELMSQGQATQLPLGETTL